MKKIQWKTLILYLAIPLATGALSGFLTRNAMEKYLQLKQPPLSPPSAVFPVVWTVLFLLMGISSYLVAVKNTQEPAVPYIYWIQLAFNFFWTLIFFNLGMYLLAFFWLLALIMLVAWMILRFRTIDRTAALLQVPYLLWLIFAGYLNLSIVLLN